MNKKNLFLLVAFLVSSGIFAQKRIYFCEDYTPEGEPIGTSNVWSIKPAGGNVYMLYKNDGINVSTSTIYIFIDKLIGSSYKEYSSESITPDKYKNWVLFDFKFTETGEYKVTFLDASNIPLTTDYISIKFKDNALIPKNKLSSDYYAESKIFFCKEVSDTGIVKNSSPVYTLSGMEGESFYVIIDHNKDLKSTELIMDIWNGIEYKDFVETKRLTIEESSKRSVFKYTFTRAGLYKFNIYNKEEVFIQAGYITINNK